MKECSAMIDFASLLFFSVCGLAIALAVLGLYRAIRHGDDDDEWRHELPRRYNVQRGNVVCVLHLSSKPTDP